MAKTISNKIEFIPQNTTDPVVGLNQALNHIDALLQLRALDLVSAPPASPAPKEGDLYLINNTPSGAFNGKSKKIARFLDGKWSFYDAYIALNAKNNKLYVNGNNGWMQA